MDQWLFRANLGRGANGGVTEHKASLIVVDKARLVHLILLARFEEVREVGVEK
jgi:hypothetical protein